jgi:branched-chain amino acid transport system substrate-binding protein
LVESGYKYVFQTVPVATEWGVAPVNLIKELMDATKWPSHTPRVAVAFEDSPYGSDTAKGARDQAKKMGWEVVAYEAYRTGFTDASPLILKLKAAKPDFLYLCSYLTDALLIQKTIKASNFNCVIIGTGVGHSMTEFGDSLKEVGDYVFTAEFTDRSLNIPGLAQTAANFLQKNKQAMSTQALGGYHLPWILKEALEIAGSSDPKAVAEALRKVDIKDKPGAYQMSRRVKFDDAGRNIYSRLGLLQWRNGELRTVWPKEVASVPLVYPSPDWNKR